VTVSPVPAAAPAHPTVGFIGLGNQGTPMARRVATAGWPLVVWARRSAAYAGLDGVAHTVAAGPADLGARCAIVGLCLLDDDSIRAVALDDGLLAAMAPGAVLVIHATTTPALCRDLGRRAAASGVEVVDAPVSGGAEAAAAGVLTVMVGGAATAVGTVRPLLETFGDPVRHVGPLGSGQAAKLVNNALFTANVGAAATALAAAVELGLDRAAVADILAHGSARSLALEVLPRLTSLPATGHAQALLDKDVRQLAAAFVDVGLAVPALAELATAALRTIASAAGAAQEPGGTLGR